MEIMTKPRKPLLTVAKKKKTKVLIVDDHPILRYGISQLINQEEDMFVCEQAESGYKAMESIEKTSPDIVVLDISLTDINGVELIKNIKVQYPDLPILALSMHDESLYAERVLRAGGRGYVTKKDAAQKVVASIRRVLKGEICVSETMAAKLLHKMVDGKNNSSNSPEELLSDRELEVFQLIGQGLGTRQIAKKLHRSVKTIESYRAHIKEKMKLEHASELIQRAIQWAQDRKLI